MFVVMWQDISITFKIRKADIYAILFRRGEGEPNPDDVDNRDPWMYVTGCDSVVPRAQWAGFSESYEMADIEGREVIGPCCLVQAVNNLRYQDKGPEKRKWFFVIVLHILEAARFRAIEEQIYNTDPWANSLFQIEHKALVKNWHKVSQTIQKYISEANDYQPFGSIDKHLEKVTMEQVRNWVAILKFK